MPQESIATIAQKILDHPIDKPGGAHPPETFGDFLRQTASSQITAAGGDYRSPAAQVRRRLDKYADLHSALDKLSQGNEFMDLSHTERQALSSALVLVELLAEEASYHGAQRHDESTGCRRDDLLRRALPFTGRHAEVETLLTTRCAKAGHAAAALADAGRFAQTAQELRTRVMPLCSNLAKALTIVMDSPGKMYC